ncbi:MAG: PAS sensor histidine kinase [Magnetococcales bacterium]|nr:PAS sensor histidine kinase [Magnetococcales bacterium]HIJ82838.1 PAS domain S-box protein [Magnetococcales bacterium]
MKLAHRLYLFLLPVIVLSAIINALHAWKDYHERIEQFTQFSMAKGLESFKILVKNPLFNYYFDDIKLGFIDDASRDMKNISLLLDEEAQRSKLLFRNPFHLGLFDKNWNVIAELFPKGKNRHDHLSLDESAEISSFADFFKKERPPGTLYSIKINNRHKMVAPIGIDVNQDGKINSEEIMGYVHHDDLLPLDEIFNSVQNETLENTSMAILQIALLSIAFFWIGRWVPRPFEMFTHQILRLPEETFDPKTIQHANIHELNVLGKALEHMSQEIQRKQDELILARDQAENSERMLRLILDTIPVRVYWKDIHGAYLGGNVHFAQAAGFETISEIIAKTDTDLCWSSHDDIYRSQDEEIINNKKPFLNLEQTQTDCAGRIRWIDESKVPLLNSHGNVTGILGTSHDITQRIKAQEERDRFFTVSPDVMCIIGPDRRFVRVNRALQELTGQPEAQLLTIGLVEITHPLDVETATHFVDRLFHTSNQVIQDDFRLSTQKQDQPVVVSWTAISQNHEIYAVGRDVTQQKQIEWKLKLTQTSVEQAMDTLFWINPEGKLVYVNSSATHALAYGREELMNKSIFDIDTDMTLEDWQGHWQELVVNKRMHAERTHRRKDGTTYPVDINAHYLHYRGEEFNISFVRDITLRKAAEQNLQNYTDNLEEMVQQRTRELAHAERLASLGTFSAGMAHEINNPNSFISGNIDFLQQYWNLARPILHNHQQEDPSGRIGSFLDEVEATLTGMKDGSRRISKIIDSLKAYSRGGMEADKVECRLADPIMDAQYLLQHRLKSGFHLITEVPNDYHIMCDRQQMSQVFVNLVNNAMDALENMGDNYEKQIKIRAERVDCHLWVRVSDNGPGIPEEAMGRIFDPFFTSKGKTKGTGLGLSIVQGIIEDHAGQITVFSTSKKTEGSEFLIILPTLDTYKQVRGKQKR